MLDFLNDELEVDAMMISPAYAYEKAPDQEHFLGVKQTRELFRAAFANGAPQALAPEPLPALPRLPRGQGRLLLHRVGHPVSYSLFGWQRPCYLMSDGYVETYKELVETTDWDKYGRGRDPRCDNCMAHCGYEPTAALATASSARESIRALVSSRQWLPSRRPKPPQPPHDGPPPRELVELPMA